MIEGIVIDPIPVIEKKNIEEGHTHHLQIALMIKKEKKAEKIENLKSMFPNLEVAVQANPLVVIDYR